MIDLTTFDKGGFGKVNHSLVNNWTWQSLEEMVKSIAEKDIRRSMLLEGGGFVCWGCEPWFKDVLDFLQPLKPEYQPRAGLYCSTTDTSKSFEPHRDPEQYIWVWQLIGSTPWQVEGTDLVLETNELLYITPNMLHCAKPNSPRASITFSLEKEHFHC
jgi:hypothetical protein